VFSILLYGGVLIVSTAIVFVFVLILISILIINKDISLCSAWIEYNFLNTMIPPNADNNSDMERSNGDKVSVKKDEFPESSVAAAEEQTAVFPDTQEGDPTPEQVITIDPFIPFGAPPGTPAITELDRRWPCTLMRLLSETDDDEWTIVMERIRTHPHEIRIQGKMGGQTPLHAACLRYPPLHIVQEMIHRYPEGALVQNFNGETPLHLASFSASEEVQEYLAKCCPASISLQDQYGDTPMHFAARSGATYGLMELLVQSAPLSICIANKRKATPIWLLPRSYLEVEAIEEVMNTDVYDYWDDWKLLCLFLKYSYQSLGIGETVNFNAHIAHRYTDNYDGDDVEDAYQLMTAFDPEIYSWTVYAAAATPSCPREVLRFLCRMFPNKALEYNSKGFTPLLLACQVPEMDEPQKWDENEDGFREHVEVAEGELQNEDQAVPEEVTLMRGDICFLQQLTDSSSESEESVIDVLLTWSPRSIIYADRDGRVPLAHAIVSGKSLRSIRRLIAACPRALECRDLPSRFYMFQLAAMHSPDLDTVYTMVRSLPELLQTGRSYAHNTGPVDCASCEHRDNCGLAATEPPCKRLRAH
jgi:hypothetical protein